MHDKQVRRRRAVLALLVVVSLILLTAYFGEKDGGPMHGVQRGASEVLNPIQDGASQTLLLLKQMASGQFARRSQRDDSGHVLSTRT